jgi:hypothetical protein
VAWRDHADQEVVLLDIFTPRREDFLKAPEASMWR